MELKEQFKRNVVIIFEDDRKWRTRGKNIERIFKKK